MARIGMNPARHRKTEYEPSRVTVVVLVYIPHLSGYFEHRLDVFKVCILSILQHTSVPYDLMVFDNASCDEVKSYLNELQEAGVVRYLITSNENIGKLGALRVISGAAPGDVIAYTDDDTFFYPNWLEAHLNILDSFPNVGMVSGSPERTLFDHGIESNLQYAESNPGVTLSYGKTIPESWEEEWAFSLGKDVPQYLEEVRDLEDIIIEQDGQRVYATACHNQFITPKSVAVEFLQNEWTGRLMGGMNELDNAIDSAGYLRLTTLDRTTRLIGNIVSRPLAEEADRYGIRMEAQESVSKTSGKNFLIRWGPSRWFLQGLYNRLFGLLSQQSGGWYAQGEQEDG
ncbi:MAG: glycosyltransferase [Anaerolineales bacterium]|nr:glycosyltransferase [Anaerolineales bacterium]